MPEANSFQVLKNHDNINGKCDRPKFESTTLAEYNEKAETSHATIEDAIEAEPEYNFSNEDAQDWIEEVEENIKLRDEEIKADQIL